MQDEQPAPSVGTHTKEWKLTFNGMSVAQHGTRTRALPGSPCGPSSHAAVLIVRDCVPDEYLLVSSHASPWREYVTLDNMLRTKTTAQVLHEAAEEEAELDGVDVDGKSTGGGGLAKVLTVWDIIAYGIGSTLGAGIFAITASGTAAAGPAIVLSFIVAAVACLFSAFSYMEFAARVPIAGSAYTFTYV